MMHSCASAAKLRGGGPILFPGMKAKGAIGTLRKGCPYCLGSLQTSIRAHLRVSPCD